MTICIICNDVYIQQTVNKQGRLHERRRYDYMDIGGRVASGTAIEKMSESAKARGAHPEGYIFSKHG